MHILSYRTGQQPAVIKAFLISLFPSLHWNNRQQGGKRVTVSWRISADLCALPHNLSFPLNSFFPAWRHPSIPWDNRICSSRVTVKMRLWRFSFFCWFVMRWQDAFSVKISEEAQRYDNSSMMEWITVTRRKGYFNPKLSPLNQGSSRIWDIFKIQSALIKFWYVLCILWKEKVTDKHL